MGVRVFYRILMADDLGDGVYAYWLHPMSKQASYRSDGAFSLVVQAHNPGEGLWLIRSLEYASRIQPMGIIAGCYNGSTRVAYWGNLVTYRYFLWGTGYSFMAWEERDARGVPKDVVGTTLAELFESAKLSILMQNVDC